MLHQNQTAFKDWGAVCAALAQGRQSLIVRKGGIHEGCEGFRVEHREFWLFPTRFHQGADQLQPEQVDLLQEPYAQEPAENKIRLGLYAVVEEVYELKEELQLAGLSKLQVLNGETLAQRFAYKRPGLYVLLVRTYQLPQPLEIENETHYGGCRSWVELTQAYRTEGLTPVLSDEQFQQQKRDLAERLH
ncbi:DUF1802 family protein [Gimesia panareensis]|uniref:Uncharacterized protein n=1 Tax=Gimesia panareensis TaxID=2527978 RepID=A0A517Q1G0_9PLAN|nr:DUF1802 family protein [Gimesia panareensis]QDT25412.1 hypothetical protein Enr10x_07080 [Gimesia panareensis]QDU48372.1 hypothetical protein Pan110_06860 [Gimesia panareensis]